MGYSAYEMKKIAACMKGFFKIKKTDIFNIFFHFRNIDIFVFSKLGK